MLRDTKQESKPVIIEERSWTVPTGSGAPSVRIRVTGGGTAIALEILAPETDECVSRTYLGGEQWEALRTAISRAQCELDICAAARAREERQSASAEVDAILARTRQTVDEELDQRGAPAAKVAF